MNIKYKYDGQVNMQIGKINIKYNMYNVHIMFEQ